MITANKLREKYFKFFKEKDHTLIPSASLIPENDPTVLFTTAGMHPLVPYLQGQKHPQGRRLVNAQKCVRTVDIDEVGDATHLTFFEMLGNWSLGDPASSDGIGAGYFKKESIAWSWEFLTSDKWLNIDPNKLYITVYEGDSDVPKDDESIKLWQEQFGSAGMEAKEGERIFPLGREDNWWGPAGQTGPCGPDTEIFYDTGKEECSKKCQPGCGCGKYVEIWNNVFMEYNKTINGVYEPLSQKNVDTGMGVERVVAVLNRCESVFEIDLFAPIIKKIEELSGRQYQDNQREFRIIADHIKAAVFMIADGAVPSNTDQGYVTRKLIRRAMHQMGNLSIKKGSIVKLVDVVIGMYDGEYRNLGVSEQQIKDEIRKDDKKAEESIESGLKAFKELEKKKPKGELMTGTEAANLQQTHSLSIDNFKGLSHEYERGLSESFDMELKEETNRHKELSRSASSGKFAGGLADHSEKSTKYHTATHLLHAALREVLGSDVEQRGSNITAERLRFDFSYPAKLSPEQIKQVEDLVNVAIKNNYKVSFAEMSQAEAKDNGAIGLFGDKYANIVKVYTVGDPDKFPKASFDSKTFSKEICGGPHVEETGMLGKFKIKKEEASSAGVRRIKATLE